MYVGIADRQMDRRTKRQTSDRITRCPRGTAKGIKMCRDYNFSPKWWYLTDLLSTNQMCVMTLTQDHTVKITAKICAWVVTFHCWQCWVGFGLYFKQVEFMSHFRDCRDLNSRSYWYLQNQGHSACNIIAEICVWNIVFHENRSNPHNLLDLYDEFGLIFYMLLIQTTKSVASTSTHICRGPLPWH